MLIYYTQNEKKKAQIYLLMRRFINLVEELILKYYIENNYPHIYIIYI